MGKRVGGMASRLSLTSWIVQVGGWADRLADRQTDIQADFEAKKVTGRWQEAQHISPYVHIYSNYDERMLQKVKVYNTNLHTVHKKKTYQGRQIQCL